VATIGRALGAADWQDGIEVVSAQPEWITLLLRCRRFTADRVMAFLEQMHLELTAEDREGLGTAVREMLLNAVEHGGGLDPWKRVRFSRIRTADLVIYHFVDPGGGFSREDLPHAAISNPPDDPAAHVRHRMEQGLRPGGFGILVSRNFVDELIYNERGNEVLLVKRLAPTAPSLGQPVPRSGHRYFLTLDSSPRRPAWMSSQKPSRRSTTIEGDASGNAQRAATGAAGGDRVALVRGADVRRDRRRFERIPAHDREPLSARRIQARSVASGRMRVRGTDMVRRTEVGHDEDLESVERDLRRLRPQDPAPDLRKRVLQAVRPASLAIQRGPAAASWRRSWAVECLLATAALLVIWLTAVVDARDARPPVAAREDETAQDCHALGRQPGDWECRRLVVAARTPVRGPGFPTRRA
jgi:anti-sigma regulatory factor (Ser/Thr protein kinase)